MRFFRLPLTVRIILEHHLKIFNTYDIIKAHTLAINLILEGKTVKDFKLYAFYFSPTGGTKNILDIFLSKWNCDKILIDLSDNKANCISCLQCVANCPRKARYINKFLLKIAEIKMKKLCADRKENSYFIAQSQVNNFLTN